MNKAAAGLRAMVLAAGYGTRLAPVTDHLPKPLLPVQGRPLLDSIIDRLFAAGIGPVAVNSHHLGELVGAHLQQHPRTDRLTHFPEAEILGTGGALHHAREFLAATPSFLVYNGDVLCDVDLAALVADHAESGALATLLLVDWPDVNSVTLGSDGAVRRIGGATAPVVASPGDRQLTYAGIGVFDRTLLDDIAAGFSSLIDPLARALARDPQVVRGFAPPQVAWNDLGTLGRWLAAAGDAADTSAGFLLQRITGHGSDRCFWRLGRQTWSAVAMVSPPHDDEFDRFVAIAGFLAAHDLGPPRLLAVDPSAPAVLMEDLGGESLYDLARAPMTRPEDLREPYRQAVTRLLELQAVTPAAQRECPLAVDRALALDQLRSETTYFQEQFLAGHLQLVPDVLEDLAPEFAALAAAVAGIPQALLHRDYQSQNLIWRAGRIRLIDFQGLRLGPRTYDLASLVWDPYVDLPSDLRAELVTAFAAGCAGTDPEVIRAQTITAGLQRVMQALGAYGFLGQVKGKGAFLAHIPGGLRNLALLLAALQELQQNPSAAVAAHLPPHLPHLTRLVASLCQLPEGG
jgi:aminoglycoside/choline kinase family phosphotransferase/choline kinase